MKTEIKKKNVVIVGNLENKQEVEDFFDRFKSIFGIEEIEKIVSSNNQKFDRIFEVIADENKIPYVLFQTLWARYEREENFLRIKELLRLNFVDKICCFISKKYDKLFITDMIKLAKFFEIEIVFIHDFDNIEDLKKIYDNS